MRLIKFKLAHTDRIVYINPEYVESVAPAYNYNSATGREDAVDNECSITVLHAEYPYHVEGNIEKVLDKFPLIKGI